MKKQKRSIKTASVPLSVILQSPGCRLDPGYYLSTNESDELERLAIHTKKTLHSLAKRWPKALRAFWDSRLRLRRWKNQGVKYHD